MSYTAEVIKKLNADKTRNYSDIIKDLISEHDTAPMLEGVRYYKSKSDITNRKMYYYDSSGRKIEDTSKENHKLVNNWHKLLVDQKASYLVGRPMVFSTDDAELSEKVELIIGDEWDDTIADIATAASNKGAEWLHVYVDFKGYFKYAIVPREEAVPIYDTSREESLEGLLRYYVIKVDGAPRYRAEWWTRDNVTYYVEDDGGEFILDDTETENPASHITVKGFSGGWGKVPFIEFPNNGMRLNDLDTVKTLIDEYDLCFSDFANNNAEVQEIITVLKGYEGTSLAEFKENLRYFKAIKVRGGNDGGVDKLEFNIPVEAKKAELDRLEENIFMFGQGVNVKTDKFGNSPSGASLEFLYTLLDLKASMMERKFKKSVKRFLWFVAEYINLYFDKRYDSNCIKASFRKNMTRNNKEIVEMLRASKDIVSDETIISFYPLIERPDEEYERLTAQREQAAKGFVNLTDSDIYE